MFQFTKMSDTIPISKLSLINSENPLDKIQDLDTLRYFLNVLAYNVKIGAANHINFPVALVVRFLEENNVQIVCEALKSGLSVQGNSMCFKHSWSRIVRAENQSEIDFNYEADCVNINDFTNDIKISPVARLQLLHALLESVGNLDELLELGLGLDFLKQILPLVGNNEFSILFVNILPHYFRLFKQPYEIVDTLFDYAVEKDDLRYICGLNEVYLNPLFKHDRYWDFLQAHLSAKDYSKYKPAVYLFRLSLNRLQDYSEFSNPNKVIVFDEQNKSEFFKSMEFLCILMDVTWEKQLHLVEPSLLSLKRIIDLHPKWLLLIYKMLLRHNHSSVVYTSVIIILQSEADFKGYLKEVFQLILNALNNAEYITLTKQAYSELKAYTKSLNQIDYELVLKEALAINWVPVGFWCVQKCLIEPTRNVPQEILISIIRNAKTIPHKYIRKGCLDFIYHHLQKSVLSKEISMVDFVDVLLEFLNFDENKTYACKLIDNRNLILNEEMLDIMTAWLHEPGVNIRKIEIIVETINRKNFPRLNWIRDVIHQPFKQRTYPYVILDRLSYTYCVKTIELEQYLSERLDVENEAFKICMIDKPRSGLIDKCNDVLTTNSSTERQMLAFEILFYANENRFKHVYTHWINRIIYKNEQISSVLALNFVNLLSKIPLDYLSRNDSVKFADLIKIYEHFFNTQPDEVAVKIFRNIDLILERITFNNTDFLELCFTQLKHMKRSEYFETAVRFFVRSFALSYEKIDAGIAEFILKELFEFSKTSDVVVFYCCLYLKQLKFDLDVFPMYEYILFGSVFGRDDCAEYEICKDIYFTFYNINPCFRTAEIHKWTIENIISDVSKDRISQISKSLIEKYRIHYKKRYFPDSLVHLHKLRIMQTFCFIIPHMPDAAKAELKELICDSFRDECHQASVRQVMQYILVQLLKDEQKCLDFLLGMVERTGKTHTSTITGFIPVMYGLELLRNDTEFSMRVVEAILPWVMGAHFKLRVYSQLVIKKICDKNSGNRKFKQKFDSVHKVLDTVITQTPQVEESIVKDMELIKYIYLEKPHEDNRKLIHLISVHIPETTSVTPIEWEYFKIKNAFNMYMKTNRDPPIEKYTMEKEFSSNVQKKVAPLQEFLSIGRKKGELILVTSLIESLANLGGLSRTCEIFGVDRMVVNNAKVVHEKEFQSLSMSSEKWVNIDEVKVAHLREFIIKSKEEGYVCIGAEQTSDSVDLDKYQFPPKTLLLLGNERSGIPPNLILLLDRCIEIPQFGMVRSLNVHVAGAMFIWEYVKQHLI